MLFKTLGNRFWLSALAIVFCLFSPISAFIIVGAITHEATSAPATVPNIIALFSNFSLIVDI